MRKPALRIRHRVNNAALIPAGECHARATCEDQACYILITATSDHVLRSYDVRTVVSLPWPPNSRDSGDMKHGFDAAARLHDVGDLANVAVNAFGSESF